MHTSIHRTARGLLAAALLAVSLSAPAEETRALPPVVAFEFEEASPGEVPDGWSVPRAARESGFLASTVEDLLTAIAHRRHEVAA